MPAPFRFAVFLLVTAFYASGCATDPGLKTGRGNEPPSVTGQGGLQVSPPGVAEDGKPFHPDEKKLHLMSRIRSALESGARVSADDLKELIDTAPESSYGRFLAGSVHLRDGDVGDAEDQFERSIALDPENVHAMTALADIALDRGDMKAADHYYTKAHEAAPSPATANRLALFRIRGGHLESAVKILSDSMEKFPADTMTRNNLAVAMDIMGAASEGIEVLENNEVPDPRLLSTRALLLLKEGRPEKAVRDLKSASAATDPGIQWLLMGIADLQRGRLDEAEGKFRSAVAAKPDGYEGYINLGLTLRRQGKFSEAEKVYLEGLARVSQPDLHLNLGVLYELYQGKPLLAMEHYRKYLELKGPAQDRVRGWVDYLEGVVEGP